MAVQTSLCRIWVRPRRLVFSQRGSITTSLLYIQLYMGLGPVAIGQSFISSMRMWIVSIAMTLYYGHISLVPVLLYPRHLCRRVYSFRLSVRPFVCSFVCSFVIPSHVKVLRQSFSSGVYLSNYLSESIHIWTIVTLEGWH